MEPVGLTVDEHIWDRERRALSRYARGFAAQEAISKVAVVEETPFFFEPITEFATKNLGLFDLSSGYISY